MSAQQALKRYGAADSSVRPQTASAPGCCSPSTSNEGDAGAVRCLDPVLTCQVNGGVRCESGLVGGAGGWAVEGGLGAAVVWIEGGVLRGALHASRALSQSKGCTGSSVMQPVHC